MIEKSGTVARAMAASNDLNLAHAVLDSDPADSRWNSCEGRCRVRYFTDGTGIGSKAFVSNVFVAARERFSAKRKNGAPRQPGNGKAAAVVYARHYITGLIGHPEEQEHRNHRE